MTGKQKIAPGAATPETIEKEKLLREKDIIIIPKSQVRPIKGAVENLNGCRWQLCYIPAEVLN